MYSITFKLNLTPQASGISPADRDVIAHSITTYVPGVLNGENLVKEHGDIFTLYGEKAFHFKRLIDQGQLPWLEIEIQAFNDDFSDEFE